MAQSEARGSNGYPSAFARRIKSDQITSQSEQNTFDSDQSALSQFVKPLLYNHGMDPPEDITNMLFFQGDLVIVSFCAEKTYTESGCTTATHPYPCTHWSASHRLAGGPSGHVRPSNRLWYRWPGAQTLQSCSQVSLKSPWSMI